ncbi:MAG: GatB/YqeY domain-containing protein [Mariprofundaceae bacterium]|nr:GatB/YqeY domain-containing protein [Mariprofundaceae bacterium]
MLVQQITDAMKQAMRDKAKDKLGVIRMLRAALKDKEIELGKELVDADVVTVAGKLIKQRKDAAKQYAEADRDDLAEKELAEIQYLSVYLPEQMSESEISKAVQQAVAESGAESMKDMGKVMGILRPKLDGLADMGLASTLVKKALQS